MIEADDGSLVARARAGDREAFGALVTRHGRAMLALARAYFASEADAEDAVQEAVLRAFRALGKLEDDGRFAAWLARITVNTCLTTLSRRTEKLSLADFASTVKLHRRLRQTTLTPAALASRGEEAELLKAAIGRLPEEQRVAVMLRYAEGMSYNEMAEYLDVPPSTVRGRLYTAKLTLRELLGPLQTTDD
ncbi:RNA polymerase sigma factor [Planctomycetota bacterium]